VSRDPKRLAVQERLAARIGTALKATLPPGIGFVVLLLDVRAPDNPVTYSSSLKRPAAIRLLRATAADLERGATAPLGALARMN
jgi:hypothetical protein